MISADGKKDVDERTGILSVASRQRVATLRQSNAEAFYRRGWQFSVIDTGKTSFVLCNN